MAFEGATKRNKPNLAFGAYVCSRVSYVDLDSGEIELTCITPEDKKTWSNNENYLGVLKNSNYKNASIIEEQPKPGQQGGHLPFIRDGIAITVPLSVAQILLADKSYVLEVLSKYTAYEICVGQNGVVWFSASTTKEMLLIMSALKIIPNCTKPQVSLTRAALDGTPPVYVLHTIHFFFQILCCIVQLEVIIESLWSKIQSQT